jgi:hypothetical protein
MDTNLHELPELLIINILQNRIDVLLVTMSLYIMKIKSKNEGRIVNLVVLFKSLKVWKILV